MKEIHLHIRLTQDEATLLSKAQDKASKKISIQLSKSALIIWLIKKFLSNKTIAKELEDAQIKQIESEMP